MHVVFVLCAHELRLRVVSTFDDRQMSGQNTRAYAFSRVACPPGLARESPFAHSPVSYSTANGSFMLNNALGTLGELNCLK